MKFSEFLDFIHKNRKLYEREKSNIIKCTSKTCSNISCGVILGPYHLQDLVGFITNVPEQESPCFNLTVKDGVFSINYNCSERHNKNVPEQLSCKLNIPIQEQLPLFIKELFETT